MKNIRNKTGFRGIVKCCFALFMISVFVGCSKTDPLDSYSRIPPDRNSQTDEEGEGDGKDGLFEKGYGTAEKPYIIMTAVQIGNMSKGLVQGKMSYFQLGADIDVQPTTNWQPLNSGSTHER